MDVFGISLKLNAHVPVEMKSQNGLDAKGQNSTFLIKIVH